MWHMLYKEFYIFYVIYSTQKLNEGYIADSFIIG